MKHLALATAAALVACAAGFGYSAPGEGEGGVVAVLTVAPVDAGRRKLPALLLPAVQNYREAARDTVKDCGADPELLSIDVRLGTLDESGFKGVESEDLDLRKPYSVAITISPLSVDENAGGADERRKLMKVRASVKRCVVEALAFLPEIGDEVLAAIVKSYEGAAPDLASIGTCDATGSSKDLTYVGPCDASSHTSTFCGYKGDAKFLYVADDGDTYADIQVRGEISVPAAQAGADFRVCLLGPQDGATCPPTTGQYYACGKDDDCDGVDNDCDGVARSGGGGDCNDRDREIRPSCKLCREILQDQTGRNPQTGKEIQRRRLEFQKPDKVIMCTPPIRAVADNVDPEDQGRIKVKFEDTQRADTAGVLGPCACGGGHVTVLKATPPNGGEEEIVACACAHL
mmetsp:Transcript_27455/g.82410  ORF Transcript_27455/g.82410 Transcript_27455/m.82410 type:complete len:402 (+) Transcript_27455:194-1399(+)